MGDFDSEANEISLNLSDLFSTDYDTAYNLAMNSPLVKELARERAREEILRYMVSKINQEMGGVSHEDAFDNWEKYKELNNIRVGD